MSARQIPESKLTKNIPIKNDKLSETSFNGHKILVSTVVREYTNNIPSTTPRTAKIQSEHEDIFRVYGSRSADAETNMLPEKISTDTG